MVQSLDARDPTLVTGTLTVRNVNAKDGGAYSCEALNNQGFIFAIPDAIVNVIIGLYFSVVVKILVQRKLFSFILNRSRSCTSTM